MVGPLNICENGIRWDTVDEILSQVQTPVALKFQKAHDVFVAVKSQKVCRRSEV